MAVAQNRIEYKVLHNETATKATARAKFPARLQNIVDALRDDCNRRLNSEPPPKTDGPYCNRTMDHIGGCWPDTLPGARATIKCPAIPTFNTQGHAYRECTINGTWYVSNVTGSSWANYSECFQNRDSVSDDLKYIYIFIGGFAFSLVLLLSSLYIFFRFRQLRCDRITIHKNLFISYVLTGVSWIMYYIFATLDGVVLIENPLWCQALHVLCQYFTVCNFLWMFCEGLYLNVIMVYAFSVGKSLMITCHIIGWGFPLILTALYAGIRGKTPGATLICWLDENPLQWIMYGPIVVSLLPRISIWLLMLTRPPYGSHFEWGLHILMVNVIFLINIVRLLVTKLRQMPEAGQTRKATRATLILVPMLGLQYLLFPFRPAEGSNLQELYHIVVALVVSLQGAFVSIMYCFCNGEVIMIIRRKWKQRKLMSRSSMRASTANDRMATTYTTVESQGNTATYCSTVDNKEPPLEMSKLVGEEV